MRKFSELGRNSPQSGIQDQTPRSSFVEKELRRGTKLVMMNQRGSVDVVPGSEARIGTFGVGGCDVVAVVEKSNLGKVRVEVAHYDPFGTPLLEQLVRKAVTPSEFSQKEVVLMTRGGWEKTASGRYVMKPEDKELESRIREECQRNGVPLLVHAYDQRWLSHTDPRSFDQGTLLVEVAKDGNVHVTVEGLPLEKNKEA